MASASWNESTKKIKYGSPGGTEVLNKDSIFNNPGCAPFTEIAGIEEYAKLSGVFNEDYLKVPRYWKNGEPDLYLNGSCLASQRIRECKSLCIIDLVQQ